MYEVSYSGRVLDAARELITRNPARAAALIAAVREFDRRLRVYPQFGEPLRNLAVPDAQLWVASIPPLTLHYVVIEADDRGRRRQVIVVRPFILLPNSGLA
ncbi:MAG TPA: hypothetical protein VH092_11870 [Urbifossiella sp.]|jgi:plasmid stabilization system protein ParE|nr:hypothetical protein [Urbifossiella sp.]